MTAPFLLVALLAVASPSTAPAPPVNFAAAVDEAVLDFSLEPIPGECNRPSAAFRVAGWAVIGTAASGLASTHYVLRSGGVEKNPFAPKGIRGMVVAKSAATAGMLLATELIRKKGHEKVALWMRIATVAAWGYVTANNIRVGHQLRGGS